MARTPFKMAGFSGFGNSPLKQEYKKSKKSLVRENAERNRNSLKKEGIDIYTYTDVDGRRRRNSAYNAVKRRLRHNPSLINPAYKHGPGSHIVSTSEIDDYVNKTLKKHTVKGTEKNTFGVLKSQKKKSKKKTFDTSFNI